MMESAKLALCLRAIFMFCAVFSGTFCTYRKGLVRFSTSNGIYTCKGDSKSGEEVVSAFESGYDSKRIRMEVRKQENELYSLLMCGTGVMVHIAKPWTVEINNQIENIVIVDYKDTVAGGDWQQSEIESIQYQCFRDYSALKSVDLTNTKQLMMIGHEAFYGCSNLESVLIPDSVWAIVDSAFRNCGKLSNWEFVSSEYPSSILCLGDYAFANTGPMSFICPHRNIEAQEYCFERSQIQVFSHSGDGGGSTSQAKSWISSVTAIRDNLQPFDDEQPEMLDLKKSILDKVISPYSDFYNRLDYIASYAFRYSGLINLTFGTVSSIALYSLDGCTKLKYLHIGKLKGTQSNIFGQCSSLQSFVYCGDSLRTWDSSLTLSASLPYVTVVNKGITAFGEKWLRYDCDNVCKKLNMSAPEVVSDCADPTWEFTSDISNYSFKRHRSVSVIMLLELYEL